jgi:hypothetical protein
VLWIEHSVHEHSEKKKILYYISASFQPQKVSLYDFCSDSCKMNEAWLSAFGFILSAVSFEMQWRKKIALKIINAFAYFWQLNLIFLLEFCHFFS